MPLKFPHLQDTHGELLFLQYLNIWTFNIKTFNTWPYYNHREQRKNKAKTNKWDPIKTFLKTRETIKKRQPIE